MLQPVHLSHTGWGCARVLAGACAQLQQHTSSCAAAAGHSCSGLQSTTDGTWNPKQRVGRTMHRNYTAAAPAATTAAASAAIEGPLYLYNEGLQTGKIRPDPLQMVTTEKLQRLYKDLRTARPRAPSPSGLTLVDHVGTRGGAAGSSSAGKTSWWMAAKRCPQAVQCVGLTSTAAARMLALMCLCLSCHQPAAPQAGVEQSSTAAQHKHRVVGVLLCRLVGIHGHSGLLQLPRFSGLSSLLNSNGNSSSSNGRARDVHTRPSSTQGLYMYGGVGCGKTMLMDLFVESAPREFQTLRTHFHDFMLDVHARLRRHAGAQDPLAHVADSIVRETKVLALDEFFVTDVADAMILHRLFARLWDQGLVLVATSNRAPDKLYEGGLQRNLFLPFIERLKQACAVHDMHSPVDYRKLAQHQGGLYFVTPDRDEALYEAFVAAAGGLAAQQEVVPVAMGRELVVPKAAGDACMFDFEELCGRPLAAADYIALADRYHTLALSDVPVFTAANRSSAYRFVTLVDVLYEHRVRLICSAEAMPFELFEHVLTQEQAQAAKQQQQQPGLSLRSRPGSSVDAVVDDQLGFSKDRTISRLTEMQSLEYLIAHAHRHAPELLLALQEAQSQARLKKHLTAQPQQREVAAGL